MPSARIQIPSVKKFKIHLMFTAQVYSKYSSPIEAKVQIFKNILL